MFFSVEPGRFTGEREAGDPYHTPSIESVNSGWFPRSPGTGDRTAGDLNVVAERSAGPKPKGDWDAVSIGFSKGLPAGA